MPSIQDMDPPERPLLLVVDPPLTSQVKSKDSEASKIRLLLIFISHVVELQRLSLPEPAAQEIVLLS